MKQPFPLYRSAIGHASHRFLPEDSSKPCVVGGVIFEGVPGLDAESDGDVALHAICNCITSLTGVPILGGIARDLCRKDGITDSQVYVERGLEQLRDQKIVHASIAIEGKRPHFEEKLEAMRKKLAHALQISLSQVGITATTGHGLTDFGCGDGIQCYAILSTIEI